MPLPNILLITVDHWRADLLGCAGHPVIQTPTLDTLAGCGTRFTQAYSPAPTCIPARRTLMTGTDCRTHGDRVFNEHLEMPAGTPTLAGCFAAAGYQTFAVGKLHVYPQRDRIGFHEAIIHEEHRNHLGMGMDDYQQYLSDQGYPGQWMADGSSPNALIARPFHLPEAVHPTTWTAREMCRAIQRRDPRQPAFWYLSFNHPHPPLTPPQAYWDLYPEVPDPVVGDWVGAAEPLPLRHRAYKAPGGRGGQLMRRGFFALCTHIDHQLRQVIGTLREEGLLANTAIVFTCDHGDMLGDHGHVFKGLMYDASAKVPLLVIPAEGDQRVAIGATDDRLATLSDVMPTLLDLAGLPIPDTCEGHSLLGETRRELLYGEHWEAPRQANRMIRDARYKLIWFPWGNQVQLFDLAEDPGECHDLAGRSDLAAVQARLTRELIARLYGNDLAWVDGDRLIGVDLPPTSWLGDRGLANQRGNRRS